MYMTVWSFSGGNKHHSYTRAKGATRASKKIKDKKDKMLQKRQNAKNRASQRLCEISCFFSFRQRRTHSRWTTKETPTQSRQFTEILWQLLPQCSVCKGDTSKIKTHKFLPSVYCFCKDCRNHLSSSGGVAILLYRTVACWHIMLQIRQQSFEL